MRGFSLPADSIRQPPYRGPPNQRTGAQSLLNGIRTPCSDTGRMAFRKLYSWRLSTLAGAYSAPTQDDEKEEEEQRDVKRQTIDQARVVSYFSVDHDLRGQRRERPCVEMNGHGILHGVSPTQAIQEDASENGGHPGKSRVPHNSYQPYPRLHAVILRQKHPVRQLLCTKTACIPALADDRTSGQCTHSGNKVLQVAGFPPGACLPG